MGRPISFLSASQPLNSLGDPTPVYRAAVQAALSDLAAAIRDPAHRLRVTAIDGAESLRVALAARDSAQAGGIAQSVRP